MMLDATTALSVALGLLVALLPLAWPRLKALLTPPPPAPRGPALVVLECAELQPAARAAAQQAAKTLWVDCSGNFGMQIKALRRVSARKNSSFAAILVIEPLRNFGELDPALGHQLVGQCETAWKLHDDAASTRVGRRPGHLGQFRARGREAAVRRYFRNLARCAAGLVPVYAVNADLSLAVLDTSSWLAPPHFRVLNAADAPPPQSVMFAVGALGRPKPE